MMLGMRRALNSSVRSPKRNGKKNRLISRNRINAARRAAILLPILGVTGSIPACSSLPLDRRCKATAFYLEEREDGFESSEIDTETTAASS
jgi:hypothetical protein